VAQGDLIAGLSDLMAGICTGLRDRQRGMPHGVLCVLLPHAGIAPENRRDAGDGKLLAVHGEAAKDPRAHPG